MDSICNDDVLHHYVNCDECTEKADASTVLKDGIRLVHVVCGFCGFNHTFKEA